MRTTLSIDEDILSVAHSLSAERKVSLGRIISDLARKGLRGSAVDYHNGGSDGLPVFTVREDAPPITPEMIKQADDEF
jgi:hypothetical protein